LQLRAEDSIETDRTIETARIEATRRIDSPDPAENLGGPARKSAILGRNAQSAEMSHRFDERISEKRVNHRRLMPRDVGEMSLVEKSANKPRENRDPAFMRDLIRARTARDVGHPAISCFSL